MKPEKICIIDDNEAVCDSLKNLFSSFYNSSFEVLTFTNPAIFLQTIEPDWKGCLIIDLFMPNLNGLDLIKKTKKYNNQMHFIIMSGHGNLKLAKQSQDAGAFDFMSKPLNIDLLLKKVNVILNGDVSGSLALTKKNAVF